MRIKFGFMAFCLALLAFSATAQTQREETVLGSRNLGFSGIWGGPKYQLARFGNDNVYVRGWEFGFEFGKSLTVGFGGNSIKDEILWNSQPGQTFDMRWRTLNLGYAFQSYRAVHPILNLIGGHGKVRYADEPEDRIFVIQPSAGIEFNVFRWLHLCLEGGYRFVTDSDISLSDRQLSGAFGQATFKFGYSWGRYRNRDKG